jgi:hypothetical protein
MQNVIKSNQYKEECDVQGILWLLKVGLILILLVCLIGFNITPHSFTGYGRPHVLFRELFQIETDPV